MSVVTPAARVSAGGDVSAVADRILAAAASCVIDFGANRLTVAEIARRAGVSRPTVYRRFPDTRSIVAALLTERITTALADVPVRGQGREAVVERTVGVAQHLRDDQVAAQILRSNPAMVYFSERLGTSQRIAIDELTAGLRAAQQGGSVRPGDPRQLAAMVLLITQSVVQSGQIVASIVDADALSAELTYVLNGYLS